MSRWKYTLVRKFAGDDDYSWAVFDKRYREMPIVPGLHKDEINYYRKRVEERLRKEQEKS